MFLDFLIPVAYAAKDDSASGQVRAGLADKIADMLDFIITQIPSWIAAVVVFILTLFVAKIARSAVENRISDRVDEEHQEVMVLSGRLTNMAVITIGTTVALKIAGIDLTTILAAVAFGIGFALRDFLANFLAGIYILTSRQFIIGDFIQIGGTVGRVMEIQSRATILKTYDGYKVVVPNSDIFTKQVTSLTTNPVRRISIPLYISYDTDIDYAILVTKKIIKKNPKVLVKPPPSVIVSAYGDSSVDLMARFWVESRGGWFKVKSDLTKKLLEGFAASGINVPYNILHLETSQDTAADVAQNAETVKAVKEKWMVVKQKKLAAAQTVTSGPAQNGGAVGQNVGGPSGQILQNNNGANLTAAQIPVAAASPLQIQNNAVPAPATVPVNPPGMYEDMQELDQNG